jgi:hypothetical protein
MTHLNQNLNQVKDMAAVAEDEPTGECDAACGAEDVVQPECTRFKCVQNQYKIYNALHYMFPQHNSCRILNP